MTTQKLYVSIQRCRKMSFLDADVVARRDVV